MASRGGFSLVELSIVLVILGLVAGGIITGQNLIRSAQLRSIPVEFQQYQTAVMSFQDKYRQIPGDMRNATDFFGAATTCPPTSAAPLTGRETCNGDGDGMIESAAVTANEFFTFWQHLSNASMIEGAYTGTTDSTTYNNVTGVLLGENLPESRISKVGWSTINWGTVDLTHLYWIEGVYNNVLLAGTYYSSGHYHYGAFLTPQEAWNIDKKIDDGLAGQGKVVPVEYIGVCYLHADGTVGARSSTEIRSNVTYDLSSNSKSCSLIFRDVF